MLKPTEIDRIMNRCIKSAQMYLKEEGTFYPMLVILKKEGPLNIEIENESILVTKNDSPDEEVPQEYITEDGNEVSTSFILFRRKNDDEGIEDDKAVIKVSKEIVKKYDPDVVSFMTLVITTDGKTEEDNVNMLYICYFVKGNPNPMMIYLPYVFKGEFPEDKKETIMVGDQTKTINYDVTFMDTSWCPKKLYTHFFKNPYKVSQK